MPMPLSESPLARTKKVAGGSVTIWALRSRLRSVWSSAGDGNPHSTPFEATGTAIWVAELLGKNFIEIRHLSVHIYSIGGCIANG